MNIKNKKEAGFTLIELMVVIALMAIIFAVTLSNYSGMNKKIELENLVYDVALSIRETQLYGINKKLAKNGFSDGLTYPFGFYIDTTNSDKKLNNKIIIFSDFVDSTDPTKILSNSKFDGSCTDSEPKECRWKEEFPKQMHISNIKLKSGVSWSPKYGQKIDIFFRRPNPDARIIIDGDNDTKYSSICIEIASRDEIYKGAVIVGTAGDIYVKKQCP